MGLGHVISIPFCGGISVGILLYNICYVIRALKGVFLMPTTLGFYSNSSSQCLQLYIINQYHRVRRMTGEWAHDFAWYS